MTVTLTIVPGTPFRLSATLLFLASFIFVFFSLGRKPGRLRGPQWRLVPPPSPGFSFCSCMAELLARHHQWSGRRVWCRAATTAKGSARAHSHLVSCARVAAPCSSRVPNTTTQY